MPVCVPIKDLKDTAKFAQLVEESFGPVTVTRNGRDAFVVMRSRDYDAMQNDTALRELYDRIHLAERQKAEGKYVDGPTAMAELREEYGL